MKLSKKLNKKEIIGTAETDCALKLSHHRVA